MSIQDVPFVDRFRAFREWHIDEIWGLGTSGKYVPNINDLLLDYDAGYQRVTHVDYDRAKIDPKTYITLEPWSPPRNEPTPDLPDLLLPDPNSADLAFYVFIDDSTLPNTMAIDSNWLIPGSEASKVRVYKGVDYNENTGICISLTYDMNQTLKGDYLDTEMVYQETGKNIAIKRPLSGHTGTKLADGELVTVVAYSDLEKIVQVKKMLIVNTSFAKTLNAPIKEVTNVRLKSPYLSPTEQNVLQVPINVNVESLNLEAVVTYNHSKEISMPVNVGKVHLHGLDSYIASRVGQRVPLTLTYMLDDDEQSYSARTGSARHYSKDYELVTQMQDNHYAFKIMVCPQWVDEITGYSLEFYLFDLTRESYYNITNEVTISEHNTPAFDPIKYGHQQRLCLTIDVDKLGLNYKPYRHVQYVTVTLQGSALNQTVPYYVDYQNNAQNVLKVRPAKYTDLGGGLWLRDIRAGFTNLDDWLDNLYHPILPLFDQDVEDTVIEPTHFIVSYSNRNVEYPIADWNKDVQENMHAEQGQLTRIVWLHKTETDDLYLGVTPMFTQLF